MEQSRFNQLKSLQESIDWQFVEGRLDFFHRVTELIEDWEDDLPNLRHIFRPADIELLLEDAVDCFRKDSWASARMFVDFVARSGYVDEPDVVRRFLLRPSLPRVTPLHRLFELYRRYRAVDSMCDRLDGLCLALLKIYDRYDVDYVDKTTAVTHFHVACCCSRVSDDDQLRIVARFLELGQDPNHVVRKTGYSPLHLALERNNGEAALLLLRAGADPNLATRDGDTPLHIMSNRKVPGAGVAETFFRACDEKNRLVRVDARNNMGKTPLVLALIYHNVEVAEILLRRGADPNSVNEFGDTALHFCARDGHDESAVTLFKICDELNLPLRVNTRNYRGNTPLELAMAIVLPDTVGLLLDHGADLYEGLFSIVINPKVFRPYNFHGFSMRMASGALAVAERLEAKGYDFSRNDALTIMKCFANLELFEKSADANNRFYDDEKFTRQAKKIMVNSSLSLYELVQMRPEEEEKLFTYRDYFRFASSLQIWKLSTEFRDDCELHMCEKLSRRFFLNWALDPFYELINKRLPFECCEMILETLNNRDLYNVCLAAAGQPCDACTRQYPAGRIQITQVQQLRSIRLVAARQSRDEGNKLFFNRFVPRVTKCHTDKAGNNFSKTNYCNIL